MLTEAEMRSIEARAWQTAEARFIAARRLRRQAVLSTWTVAIASIASITLSIHAGVAQSSSASSLSRGLVLPVSVSLVALVAALIDGSLNRDVQAHLLHESADALRAFVRVDLPLFVSAPDAERRYARIIRRCLANHSAGDYRLAVANYDSPLHAIEKFKHTLYSEGLYWVAMLLSCGAVAAALAGWL